MTPNPLTVEKEKYLFDSEAITYQTTIHWISLVLPIIKIILGFIGILIIILPFGLFKIIGVYLVYLLLKGILDFIYLKSIKVCVTKHYLSITMGILSRSTIDTPLNKSENICFYQSLLGRMLNYGKIIIDTGGLTQSYILKNPLELRTQILKQI